MVPVKMVTRVTGSEPSYLSRNNDCYKTSGQLLACLAPGQRRGGDDSFPSDIRVRRRAKQVLAL